VQFFNKASLPELGCVCQKQSRFRPDALPHTQWTKH